MEFSRDLRLEQHVNSLWVQKLEGLSLASVSAGYMAVYRHPMQNVTRRD